jgi:hypothetical protein
MEVTGQLHAPTALSRKRDPCSLLIGSWLGFIAGLNGLEKKKILHLLEIEPWPLSYPARNLSICWIRHPGSWIWNYNMPTFSCKGSRLKINLFVTYWSGSVTCRYQRWCERQVVTTVELSLFWWISSLVLLHLLNRSGMQETAQSTEQLRPVRFEKSKVSQLPKNLEASYGSLNALDLSPLQRAATLSNPNIYPINYCMIHFKIVLLHKIVSSKLPPLFFRWKH